MRIITTLLCSAPDPQRGFTWSPGFSQFIPWADSIHQHGHLPVVLTDTWMSNTQLGGWMSDPAQLQFVKVPPGGNPYFHRWQVIADYLDLSEHEPVWCTDGTDVVMLHDPDMNPGELYIAEDVYPVGCEWMWQTCPDYRPWIDTHQGLTLMNAGVIGGSAGDVREVAQNVASHWPVDAVHDMAAFNIEVLYLLQAGWPIVVGDPVNTTMHAYDHAHPTAWWAHK